MHYHKCKCSHIWSHGDEVKVSDEVYAKAHLCPKCGTDERTKCGPNGEPYVPDPAEAAADLLSMLFEDEVFIMMDAEPYQAIRTAFGVESLGEAIQQDDGRWRVPFPRSTLDMLKKSRLPGEDRISDTILRIEKEGRKDA
jgi:hypothetical protein